MKKNILIVILILVVFALGGYITYDKLLSEKKTEKVENKKLESSTNTIKEEDTNKNDTNKAESINITINDDYDNYERYNSSITVNSKNIIFTNIYYYNKIDDDGYYNLYNEVYENNKNIVKLHLVTFYSSLSELKEGINELKGEFSLAKFQDSMSDNEYIALKYLESEDTCSLGNYKILDETGKEYGEIPYDANCGWSSLVYDSKQEAKNQGFNIPIDEYHGNYYLFNKQMAYIVDDKEIYYIEDKDCEEISVYKFIINNGKTNKQLFKTYSENIAEGGQC